MREREGEEESEAKQTSIGNYDDYWLRRDESTTTKTRVQMAVAAVALTLDGHDCSSSRRCSTASGDAAVAERESEWIRRKA